MTTFNEMPINNGIKMALEDMGFVNPTPIQEQAIPLILEHNDVIAQAPTGTGKTCAFGIPIVNNIDVSSESIQALILCPTRELVIQTEAELKEVAKYNKEIKIVSIYGGQNFDRQLAGLRKKPQIVVGTTGRVMDHLRRKSLKLESMKTLILDEVDEMLDMGFREDIDTILLNTPKTRQTVLFSATLPKGIVEISKLYQTNPLSVKTLHEESDIPNINQFYVNVSESEKISALTAIFRDKKYSLALVFCNTKKRVDELSSHLAGQGFSVDALHGDCRQRERDNTMKKFKGGETQILIATDVAARGIDVENIDAVFNFDIPHDEEYYVHRIGRTARANKIGDAYTFATDKQLFAIKNFERFTKGIIERVDYTNTSTVKEIDKKLFDKTLKIVKRKDLTEYKDFLTREVDAFIQKYEDAELLDIAAALLMQINDTNQSKSVSLSEPPALRMKKERVKAPPKGVKFFMNIGTRDKCDPSSIAKFIATNTTISQSDISVKCLENYSFAIIANGNNDEMESLNGQKYNKRILAVEVAETTSARKPSERYGKDDAFSPASTKKPIEKFGKKDGFADANTKKSDEKYGKKGDYSIQNTGAKNPNRRQTREDKPTSNNFKSTAKSSSYDNFKKHSKRKK